MCKLTLADIKIIGEGPQIRKAIEQRFNSLEAFYKVHSNIAKIYNTFVNYLSREAITSDTFKCKITRIFDVDYPSLFVSIEKQIKDYVQNIYDNIILYKQESDQETFYFLLIVITTGGAFIMWIAISMLMPENISTKPMNTLSRTLKN